MPQLGNILAHTYSASRPPSLAEISPTLFSCQKCPQSPGCFRTLWHSELMAGGMGEGGEKSGGAEIYGQEYVDKI